MSCALSSQLNGKCIELVQAPGQSSIFTMCELPSTIPLKLSTRRNSWSSDGIVHACPVGGPTGEGFWRATESVIVEGTVGIALALEHQDGTCCLATWTSPLAFSWVIRCLLCPSHRFLVTL